MGVQVSAGKLRADTQEKDDVEKEDATNDMLESIPQRKRKRTGARNTLTSITDKKQKRENLEEQDEGEEDEVGETCKALSFVGMPDLETRMSPFTLVKLINKLSDTQKASLKETPFKHFLCLELTKIPHYLAHYVVSKFDHEKSEIWLENERLPVTKEDVEKTLGLPMGTKKIVIPSNLSTEAFKNCKAQWTDQFKMLGKKPVTLKCLRNFILKNNGDAGPMFKINIILYIITSLIYCRGNNTVFSDILPQLIDTDKLDEWNWCEFVIDRLKVTRSLWEHGKAFNGPLLFLLIHYVDRESACPRFKGWTTKRLNAKQEEWIKKGSGLGDVEKGAPDLETLLETQPPENVDEEINEGDPDLETLLETQPPENVDEEINEGDAEMLYDYAKTIEKLADNFKELQSKTVTLMKIMPNHEKLMMECHKAFNVSISNETYVDNCQDKFFGKVAEALTKARQTYVQMINLAYAQMRDDKDEREEQQEEEEEEEEVVAGNSNNHSFDDNHSWFSTRERSRPSRDFGGKNPPEVCPNVGRCDEKANCRYLHSFHEYAMLQSHTSHVETDHIAKAASLGHKNVAPSGLPASHPSNASILKSKLSWM